jgi:hypothetical protein
VSEWQDEAKRLAAVIREAVDDLDALLCSEDLDAEKAMSRDVPQIADFLRREVNFSLSARREAGEKL